MLLNPANITRSLTATLFSASVALGLSATVYAETPTLPGTMTWSSYDVGSAGYAEASAIADAFGKKYGTRIRIKPSGSAIGRLQPLLSGDATVGFLATETFFAAEGVYDFATRRWGPQDLRVLAGRPSSFGIFTAADANIKTLADLKGHRFAYVAGNPSVNVKCDAFLAFAGLSRDDVDAVMFPTYASAMGSLARNEADASCTTSTPSHVYELAESPRGIRWLDMDPNDKEAWDQLGNVAPFLAPYKETTGAGISKDNPVNMVAYRYPMLVVRADADADEVYTLLKAVDETYPMYKDATAVMHRWDPKLSGVPAIDVPFHEGAIRYLKEKGIWTDEHQAWNDTRTVRLNALLEAWPKAIAEGKGKSDEEFAEIWEKHRQKVLGAL
ncbi:TAXI family TRAP transporter solute-binding subunit [Marinobacter sp. NP-4(2019)]|uniref:TAXI family TRAP transporter solute-binding subunit n=1 Tax=Marinobacter sp. NP-4(2019) TaxID=2488665 RepID=UPI000FC3CEDE|nr:TAXI family TRAP transporter solute-binding subunit [Marinobacter sp. NP-4(2019)]AZT83431.1 TAXI family TRAP transporter solute-binding subunit [Marinobacter sp. NP-4(2019)]